MNKKGNEPAPGDGLRSLRSTMLFRAVNYELYVKPNKMVMLFGLVTMLGCTGYILYMRQKDDGTSYYSAIESDGTVTQKKKTSKWTD